MSELTAVVRSARWATYGDVLGFITELTNSSGLLHRAGTERVHRPIPWRRKVGGLFGVEAAFPEGTYSDDTQLRLATSRAIRGDGRFDVEAFAKIELTVWAAYALGAGKGSRAAAASLTNHVHTWSTNFFDDKNLRYVDVGGNGAAMRIQPHVWAARNRSDMGSYLSDVVRNSITTHGHPRGFLGAAFHALVLAYALEKSTLPKPAWVQDNLSRLRLVGSIVREDANLQDFWLKKWEAESKRTFASAVEDTIREIQELMALAMAVDIGDPAEMYRRICGVLDLRSGAVRGSGTHTAVAAYFLALLFHDDPIGAVVTAANELGTDTDSIATMAGALLGSVSDVDIPGQIQDASYIDAESRRLEAVSQSLNAATFAYPDLLHWQPPQSQSDAVGLFDGKAALSGLGYVSEFGETFRPRGKASKTAWQWMWLDTGQSILAKVREPMPELPPSSAPVRRDATQLTSSVRQLPLTGHLSPRSAADREQIPSSIPHGGSKGERSSPLLRGERFWDIRQPTEVHSRTDHVFESDRRSSQPALPDIESLAQKIEDSGFRHDLIGRYIERFAQIDNGPELVAVFASAVVRRLRRRRGKSVETIVPMIEFIEAVDAAIRRKFPDAPKPISDSASALWTMGVDPRSAYVKFHENEKVQVTVSRFGPKGIEKTTNIRPRTKAVAKELGAEFADVLWNTRQLKVDG